MAISLKEKLDIVSRICYGWAHDEFQFSSRVDASWCHHMRPNLSRAILIGHGLPFFPMQCWILNAFFGPRFWQGGPWSLDWHKGKPRERWAEQASLPKLCVAWVSWKATCCCWTCTVLTTYFVEFLRIAGNPLSICFLLIWVKFCL